MTFWLDLGVAGFRADAVPYLFEDAELRNEPLSNDSSAKPDEWQYLKHIYTSNLEPTFDMIYQWRKHLDDYSTSHGGDVRYVQLKILNKFVYGKYFSILITEGYSDIDHTILCYGDGEREGAHFAFNFFLITGLKADATAQDVVDNINAWMSRMSNGHIANWVVRKIDIIYFSITQHFFI